jgi:hypothetical protein
MQQNIPADSNMPETWQDSFQPETTWLLYSHTERYVHARNKAM